MIIEIGTSDFRTNAGVLHGIKWKYITSNRYIEIAKTNYIMLDVWTTSNQWIKSYYIDFMYYSICIKRKKYKV